MTLNTRSVFGLLLYGGLSLLSASANLTDVKGSVKFEDGSAPSGVLAIELRTTDMRQDQMFRTQTQYQGEFEIRQVPYGAYVLRVMSQNGDLIRETPVMVNGPSTTFEATIPGTGTEQTAAGTISVRRLKHKVPKNARREFERYHDSRAEDDWKSAEMHLTRALELDAEFLEARVNLGALYARQKNWPRADAEIERALALDPSCSLAWSNRAFVRLHQSELPEAEQAARAAIRYQPDNSMGHYLLGLALAGQGKPVVQVKRALEAAAPTVPAARALLNRLR